MRRNFPVIGHARYILESIRPEIRQYFIESDFDAVPFTRIHRSVVYKRAKRTEDAQSFGTRHNVYEPGYEVLMHSMRPVVVPPDRARVTIGTANCTQVHLDHSHVSFH